MATLDSQWTPVTYDISSVAAGQGSVYIKFTMGPTNSARDYSGWNIDDLEVTSEALYPVEGTMGTEFTIPGSGFGIKKGKVLIGNTSATILGWDNGIRARLTKVLAPGVYDVTIVPSAPKGAASIIQKDAFVIKPPQIDSIERASGTAWDEVTIRGKFFGKSKGKIYLQYEKEDGTLVRKSCKVLSWTMDVTTGEGEIVFLVPVLLPEVCDVVVDSYGALPETEDEDGFAVKAPEIVAVDPGGGMVGEQIRIHGKFLGTKKGKVYLGYELKGKATKKSCTVVSWDVDSTTAEGEGDIVFVVPKGLTPGHYDLIVTNSVGSHNLLKKLTIK